jgi:hypothetical protein
VDASLAIYEHSLDAWHWVFDLYPDRIVIKGVSRDQQHRSHVEVELRHCSDILDHGETTYVPTRPTRVWVAGTAVVFLIVFTVIGALALGALLADPNPGGVVGGAVGLTILFTLLISRLGLPFILQRRVTQEYVTFKRHSDGSVLFSIYSSEAPPDNGFDEFVAAVTAAIRRQRGIDPQHEFAIKR